MVSLYFLKKLPWDSKFVFCYDFDAIKYNEITDASSILNHLRFTLSKKISELEAGGGYDLGIFTYPYSGSADFLFHKGFTFLKHTFTKNTYQQLLCEWGVKDYMAKEALADTIATYQDDKRLDERKGVEYSLGSTFFKNIFLKLRTKFTLNDSNATYLDFYDYKSYEASPSIVYRFSKKVDIVSRFSYTEKKYAERLVTNGVDRQKDKMYAGNVGVRYSLTKQNILSVMYTYRDTDSNDPFSSYSENVISCGWQYNF